MDLSAFAGDSIRVAFHFTSDGSFEYNGWYLDDVALITGPYQEVVNKVISFETGWGDWSADNGQWEVGPPTVGPDTVVSGLNCAGTVLGGNYAEHSNTRLISPPFEVPLAELVRAQ